MLLRVRLSGITNVTQNNNLVSSAVVYPNNQYAEFTTLFRIPFKESDDYVTTRQCWTDLMGSWADTCIRALNMRMDSCVSMLFRNRENVLRADEYSIVFKKSNGQIHSFNHPSFNAMLTMVDTLKRGYWDRFKEDKAGIRQLLKALYWIPEEDRKDHGGFGFGQLISCLEEFTL